MSFKLLIGYDGSDFAKRAIEDLRHAALGNDVEALVLTGADVWPPVLDHKDPRTAPHAASRLAATAQAIGVEAMKEAEAIAKQGASFVRELFPRWIVRSEADADSPGRALVERAEAWRPDLMLVGAHGRSAAAQAAAFVLRVAGSVSQRVVRAAPCSVRIGRGAAPPRSDKGDVPARLIVGLDGSSESGSAVHAIAARRWPRETQVKVITVLDVRAITSLPFAATSATMADPMRGGDGPSWARQIVDHGAQVLRDAGLIVMPIVLEGDPKHVMIHEAAQWNADCIFVGAHGMSRIERFMIGSVSGAVAERAGCSVEVVRRASSK